MREYFASNETMAIDIVARLKQAHPASYVFLSRDNRYTFCPFVYKCCLRSGQHVASVYFRRFYDDSIANEFDAMTSVDDPYETLPF